MVLRAVFFDLDDTLCDTIGCCRERLRTALGVVQRAYPALDVEAAVACAMEPIAEPRAVRGLRAVLAELGVHDHELVERAVLAFDTDYASLHLFPGVVETLELLASGFLLGVISNAETYQSAKLECLRIAPFFSAVALSGEAGFRKPDARIFEYALRLAGVDASEAVFVGDRLDVDIGGARAAGLKTVWFNHWGGLLEAGAHTPDAVISRFEELPEALARCSA
jgi:putative hydrolase of the HAD superfamily